MDNCYGNVINGFLGIIIICDKDGNIYECNDEALEALGYTKDEITGVNIESVFLDKNFIIRDEILNCQDTALIPNQSIYRKNTTCFPVRIKITRDNDRYIIAALDISEFLQAQKEAGFVSEKIAEAMKVKDEFTANVTHELRTPVNGIKGHTQYLMMTELNKDQEKELKIINECCLNMEKLINNILDFAKLEAGKFSLSDREFSFSECMKYITETNGKLIEDKGLRFIINIDGKIPDMLYGDDFRLIQIMNNLLANALKFTQKGYIAIEVSKSMQVGHDVELFFMVMDTGIGIPIEKKEALFQSFTQADASISRSYGGTGLGLAITKQLVELMGGNIRLESEVGKGSSFSFSIRVKIPENVEVQETEVVNHVPRIDHAKRMRMVMEESSLINKFGTQENFAEIRKISEKLILCIDMDNYQKAEQFADSMKSLVIDGPPEIKQAVFKMTMMIRKEDGKQAREFYENAMNAINSYKKE